MYTCSQVGERGSQAGWGQGGVAPGWRRGTCSSLTPPRPQVYARCSQRRCRPTGCASHACLWREGWAAACGWRPLRAPLPAPWSATPRPPWASSPTTDYGEAPPLLALCPAQVPMGQLCPFLNVRGGQARTGIIPTPSIALPFAVLLVPATDALAYTGGRMPSWA